MQAALLLLLLLIKIIILPFLLLVHQHQHLISSSCLQFVEGIFSEIPDLIAFIGESFRRGGGTRLLSEEVT